MRKHLAIFAPFSAKEILEGKKTIEGRFSKHKIVPFGQISCGDLVFIKPVGKEIVGQFLVDKVISFENIGQTDWDLIKTFYDGQLFLGSEEQNQKFLKTKSEAKFGTIIFISRVERFLTSPVKIEKHDRRGWIVLD